MLDYTKKNLNKELLEQQEAEKDSLFSTCTLVGREMYAFTSFKKLPIKVDLQTGKIILLKKIKNYDSSFWADSMLSVDNDIFVLELNGNRLLKYNVNVGIYEYFSINCHSKEWDNYAVFAQYGKYLYIISRDLEELIKIEIESGKIQRDRELHLKLNIENKKSCKYAWYGFKCRRIIWLFQKKSNWVVAYDMRKNAWEKYKLSVEINDCVHAVQYNERLYILSSEGNIYSWNIADKLVDKIADCSNKEADNNMFWRLAVTNKNIYVLPALGEDIFCIDLETRQTSKYESYPDDFRYCGPEGWSKYYGYCEDNDNYYFAMRSMNFMLILNKKSGREQWIKPQLPTKQEYEKEYLMHNIKLLSDREISIEELVDYLNAENVCNKNENLDLIGKQIWKQIKL